jgi:thiol-disulfide isomerase/thioredoxin
MSTHSEFFHRFFSARYRVKFFLLLTLFMEINPLNAKTPQPGLWRFRIQYPNEVSIPFLLELSAQKKGWSATLWNGKEKISLNEIKATPHLWIIPLGTYQNYLELTLVDKKSLSGFFVKGNRDPVEKIPLQGEPWTGKRFPTPAEKPSLNLSGKWKLEMLDPDGQKTQAIALFDQSGSSLNATILTPAGDLRYIDGIVEGAKFKTAAFDGVFHFLFEGEIQNQKLTARLAAKTITSITGEKNDKADLPEASTVPDQKNISFDLPNLEGKSFTLSDQSFVNKPLIIQIFGSWCPNCIDETEFLKTWKKNHPLSEVQIITLAFERDTSPERALSHLKKVVAKRNIPWTVLLAGTTVSDKPTEKIKGLTQFSAYPTTLFLNRKHEVVKIHTGFNGPGTGLYYDQFKKFFDETIRTL